MPRRGPKPGDEVSALSGRHIPVLLASVLEALKPRGGETYVDATFGAGGYARAILEAAKCKVIAFDRDPTAVSAAAPMLTEFADRLKLIQAPFGDLLDRTTSPADNSTAAGNSPNSAANSTLVGTSPNTGLPSVGTEVSVGALRECVDGIVFDLGVSSMQLDEAARGFSFQADGPLDMRMESPGSPITAQASVESELAGTPGPLDAASQTEDGEPGVSNPPNTTTNAALAGSPPNTTLGSVGAPIDVGAQESAADVVNTYSETDLANIIYYLGEERRSRAIAKAIVARRAEKPFTRTLDLANLIAKVVGRGPPGKHPATRTFQALRMYVNDELGQLVKGLAGAERALKPGGRLVVVTFHSLEDRIVKRFIASRSGKTEGVSRHMPAAIDSNSPASFQIINLRSLTSSKAELKSNPRARSARLRSAVRTDADPWPIEAGDLGLPQLDIKN